MAMTAIGGFCHVQSKEKLCMAKSTLLYSARGLILKLQLFKSHSRICPRADFEIQYYLNHMAESALGLILKFNTNKKPPCQYNHVKMPPQPLGTG